MGVEQTKGILTEKQFNSSPFKNFMSYDDYLKNALRLGSAFTFARALNLQWAENKSEKIEESVKGWALEKEAQKAQAEEEYYAALAQYKAMEHAKEKAYKELEYMSASFGNDSTRYSDALKKYRLSAKTSFDANINLDCARDKFDSANISAFKAFLTTRGLS